MKPFFGIDITTDKKNETSNAERFLAAKPSKAAENKNALLFDDAFEGFKDAIKGDVKKTNLIFGAIVSGFFGLVFLVVYLASRLSDGQEFAPWWVLAVGFASVALSAVLAALAWRCGKFESKWSDFEGETDRVEDSIAEIYAELGVPKETRTVEAIGFFYREKDGEVCPCKAERDQSRLYYGYTFKGYARDGRLCLACLDGVFAVPLSELRAIRTIRQRIVLPEWVKSKPITHESYKPYKLTRDSLGNVHARWYHVLEFEQDGETWGIWFPNYDLPAYEKLTGLKAEE